MHRADLVMDFQYGSTGKGLIVGYLAKRVAYDTAVCSFATNAGHTYVDAARGIHVMTQQLPVAGVVCDTVKNILIGPGAAISAEVLTEEIKRYSKYLVGKRIMIHPHAVVVEDYHIANEITKGRTKIGSTGKGVGEAYVERIRRSPDSPNVVKYRWAEHGLGALVCTEAEYRQVLEDAETVMIEGAQGFSLSMYHGQYPYTTSRDVTPMQIMADCGIPFKWAPYIQIIGTLRTFPIRVNNRDGSSGPCYPDQTEIDWADLGVAPELTTVTKLPRRVFTFSIQQLTEALWHCGGYYNTQIFLNFANYFKHPHEVGDLIHQIQSQRPLAWNQPEVKWVGWGADDANITSWSTKA